MVEPHGPHQELARKSGLGRTRMIPEQDGQKRRVFIVDDHPLVREWLTTLINQQPDLAVCGEAATAAEAIQAVGASKPEAAIVDISLTDSSGIELIKELKKACPSLVVLVLSMHEESHYAERALRAGRDHRRCRVHRSAHFLCWCRCRQARRRCAR